MNINEGPQPNCSEAVFRFYTLDPKEMWKIISGITRSLRYTEIEEVPKFNDPEDYDGFSFSKYGIVTVQENMNAFIVNCKNNHLSDHFTDVVMDLDISVEEGESSDKLYSNFARDCTCGKIWFNDYEKQLSKPISELEKEVIRRDKK